MASYFLNSPVDIAPNYEGRASLEVNVERKTSTLRLTGVTMKDSRHYQCSVKISGDDEGTTAASTSVLVLGNHSHTDAAFLLILSFKRNQIQVMMTSSTGISVIKGSFFFMSPDSLMLKHTCPIMYCTLFSI